MAFIVLILLFSQVYFLLQFTFYFNLLFTSIYFLLQFTFFVTLSHSQISSMVERATEMCREPGSIPASSVLFTLEF